MASWHLCSEYQNFLWHIVDCHCNFFQIWNHPDVLHHYLLKKEGEDLDLDQEEQLSPAPTGSSGRPEEASPAPADQLTSESSVGGHFAKKEEINYEWAQVLSFRCDSIFRFGLWFLVSLHYVVTIVRYYWIFILLSWGYESKFEYDLVLHLIFFVLVVLAFLRYT